MIEQRVTLRYDAQQIPAIVQAVQGDTGRDVIFELADYEIPAGATANYYIDKPDGNAVYNSAEVISSTEILAHLTEQALAEPGRNNGQVRILSDGEVITSFDFVLEVEAFRGLMRMQSETEVNIFDEAIQTAAEDAIEEIQAQTPVVTGMQNSIAPAYSASSTYAVGDYVMYNAQLYKCNTAITTEEAWTAAHWTQVPIASDVSDLKSALDGVAHGTFIQDQRNPTTVSNGWKLEDSGLCSPNGGYELRKYPVIAGQYIKIKSDYKFQFQNSDSVPSSGEPNRVGITYGTGLYYLYAPETATYLIVSSAKPSQAEVTICVSSLDVCHEIQDSLQQVVNCPTLRNGSCGNGANVNAVASLNVMEINPCCNRVIIQYIGKKTGIYRYMFGIYTFDARAAGMTSSEAFSSGYSIRREEDYYNGGLNHAEIIFDKSEKYFCFQLFAYDANGGHIPLRIAEDGNCLCITNELGTHASIDDRKLINVDVNKNIKNAQHISHRWNETVANALNILHFSDLHGDTAALSRIINDCKELTPLDEIICTGDMVADIGASIASWWDASILTCVGNHESATKSGGVYDWTGVSMATRDTYYIAPFESEWNIVHTSGTSYYYKDYASKHVRLIVMDAMLYTNNGSEATAQTDWLANLLSDAITNNLHVLIAIHAPHGGATAKECSFSRYNQSDMPTYEDCNTPQDVIDTVASAIASGLLFIGYLVGHTHQDNIWDAENDGTQLMYCVTCSAVAQLAQWVGSDQFRDTRLDAYNIVSIDTEHTLIKIIRGGGADIDDHMRTRKAICFNYSTGEIVGEIL